MLKDLARRYSLVAAATVVLVSSPALAVTTTATFDFGSVVLSVTDSSGTSILQDSSDVTIPNLTLPLGGSFVTFDPDLGANGTLLDLLIESDGPFDLNYDDALGALGSATVTDSMLTPNAGATAALSPSGGFFLDTLLTGSLTGVFSSLLGGGPFPAPGDPSPFTISSINSGAAGTLVVLGDEVTLGVFGINLATFGTVTDPNDQTYQVKADFTFVGTIPEPGTAILLGFGLALLGHRARP